MRKTTLSLALVAALTSIGLLTFLMIENFNGAGSAEKEAPAKNRSESAKRSTLSGPSPPPEPSSIPEEWQGVLLLLEQICARKRLHPFDTKECNETCELLNNKAPEQELASGVYQCGESIVNDLGRMSTIGETFKELDSAPRSAPDRSDNHATG